MLRAAERMGGANTKSGAHNIDYTICKGVGGTPPENFEVLHALKRVLGASEAPFCACIQYINVPESCRLRSDQKVRRTGPWLMDCAVLTICSAVCVLAA